MDVGFPVLAGTMSTLIFASSLLPMLLKAARTKDLSSYSLGNIVLSNVGNVIHSVYVFHLPPGPIWALHTFYLVELFSCSSGTCGTSWPAGAATQNCPRRLRTSSWFVLPKRRFRSLPNVE